MNRAHAVFDICQIEGQRARCLRMKTSAVITDRTRGGPATGKSVSGADSVTGLLGHVTSTPLPHPGKDIWGLLHEKLLKVSCQHSESCELVFALTPVQLLVDCLTSKLHVGVLQGRACPDNCTCCHTELEVCIRFSLNRSHADTGPTSSSADPGRLATGALLSESLV